MSGLYLDTSALAKWYLNEPGSSEFEAFISRQAAAAISRLTVLEFRCLVARRCRAGDIDVDMERAVLSAFDADVQGGVFHLLRFDDRLIVEAVGLIGLLAQHPLRALDALHLSAARAMNADRLATADQVMAGAATALGIAVDRFDGFA